MSRVALFGQISEINDHLCLSGAGVVEPRKLHQKKITSVINVTVEEPEVKIIGVDYMKIRVDDSPVARLDVYFDMVADRIKNTKDHGGRTLVHCVAGVSRSASLCIVYLIKHEQMTLRQAYRFVKSARPIIHPNVGFWKQMIDFERRQNGGRNSVSMIPIGDGDRMIPDVYSDEILLRRQTDLARSILSTGNNYNSNSNNRKSSSSSSNNSKYYFPPRHFSTESRRSFSLTPSSSSSPRPSTSYAYSFVRGWALTPSIRRSSYSTVPNRHKYKNTNNNDGNRGGFFASIYQTSQDILFPSF